MAFDDNELRGFHGRWTAGSKGSDGADKIVKSLGGRKGPEAAGHLNSGKGVDTQKVHIGKDGKYTPERAKLHEAIITHFMRGSQAQRNPEAVFTAGGAASGKAGLAGQAKDSTGKLDPSVNLPIPKGSVYVNPDDIKAMLPEHQRMQEEGRSDVAASATHEESGDIARQLTAQAMSAKRNVVIDGTGNAKVGKFGDKLRTAKESGYKVTARYAHLPLETAKEREVQRAARGEAKGQGRKVDHSILEHQHHIVSKGFADDVRHIHGIHVEVYSTAGMRGSKPSLIAEKKATDTKVTPIDRAKYQAMLDKGAGESV
jgi:hypothetical protein